MALMKLYNTLTRKKQIFKPLNKSMVGFYSCGPTIYNHAHIGNLRAMIFYDSLKRALLFNGFKVKHIMNITDVEDKTIRGAREMGISLESFTGAYDKSFKQNLQELNVMAPDHYPYATKYINEIINLIKKLLQKGLAYQGKDESVYFDISKFRKYGKLSRLKYRIIREGARVALDEYGKEQASDFVLWKAWKPEDGDVFWHSPWGKGRPGWHIECSAMALKNLGQSFDIHAGAVDLIFPHHENEIAQSEGATGKPFVKYWLHLEHLLINKQKMSKSLKNDFKLNDIIERGFNPLAFRYLCLTAHYRAKLNFTWESLKGAEESLNNLYNFVKNESSQGIDKKNISKEAKKIVALKNEFKKAMDDDLGTPRALAVAWRAMHLANKNEISKKAALNLLFAFDRVLGLRLADQIKSKKEDIPEEAKKLAADRDQARIEKNFARADEIRRRLLNEFKLQIGDTPSGPKLKKS